MSWLKRRPKQPTSAVAQANTRIEKGRLGEDIAVEHLEASGYRIIERNFRCKLGEIDIIAEHNGDVVFVEVRSRQSDSTFDPAYSVNYRKQQKLVRAAQVYLFQRFRTMPAARFDVVLVDVGHRLEVEIIRDAFGAEG
ncbi:MAG: YraN family protein [Desulfomonile sp.]|nr:YraN family protein [Desulfomonile sp.]